MTAVNQTVRPWTSDIRQERGKKQRLRREKRAVGSFLRIKSLLSNVFSPVVKSVRLDDETRLYRVSELKNWLMVDNDGPIG